MKKMLWTLSVLLTCLAAVGAWAAGDAKSEGAGKELPNANRTGAAAKILIVYYSRTNNTEEIAKLIEKQLGGDRVRLETATPYPEDYRATTEQAKREIEAGHKPPLKTKVENLAQYDLIFVGSPNWWSTIAPPVATFLTEYDLSGKTIVPFMTHAGTGLGRTMEEVKKLSPESTVLEGRAFRGSQAKDAEKEVAEWLTALKITR